METGSKVTWLDRGLRLEGIKHHKRVTLLALHSLGNEVSLLGPFIAFAYYTASFTHMGEPYQ